MVFLNNFLLGLFWIKFIITRFKFLLSLAREGIVDSARCRRGRKSHGIKKKKKFYKLNKKLLEFLINSLNFCQWEIYIHLVYVWKKKLNPYARI